MGGVIQKGDRAGEPMPIKRVRLNTLCTMTTRDPGEKEKERYIFGVYLIGTSTQAMSGLGDQRKHIPNTG